MSVLIVTGVITGSNTSKFALSITLSTSIDPFKAVTIDSFLAVYSSDQTGGNTIGISFANTGSSVIGLTSNISFVVET